MSGLRLSAVLATAAIAGCTLLVDTSGLDDGPRTADAGALAEAGADAGTNVDGGSDAGVSSYAAVVLADRPVAYWRFEEATATEPAADTSGQGHAGSYEGGVMLGVPGLPGGGHAARFDGRSGRLRIGDTLGFIGNPAFSIEAWILPETVDPSYRIIVSKLGSNSATPYFLDLQSSDGLTFGRMDTDCRAKPTLAASQFHHVVATYDGRQSRLYVDGQQLASANSTAAMTATTSALQIGGAQDGTPGNTLNGTWFAGSIDEVAFYDVALAADRVAVHYAAGQGP